MARALKKNNLKIKSTGRGVKMFRALRLKHRMGSDKIKNRNIGSLSLNIAELQRNTGLKSGMVQRPVHDG